jgi:prevent-host-death family protein
MESDMRQVNIHQAKTQLSKLVEAAAQGEEIIIAKSGKPLARLVQFVQPEISPCKPGALKGKIWISEDFDDSMNEEELSLWVDNKIIPENQDQ